MKSRDCDSGSDDTTTGRDSWRSARGKETVMLTTPRPRVGVSTGWSEEEESRRGRGWSRRRLGAEMSRRSPGPAALGIYRGGSAGGLLDPLRPHTVPRHRALVHAGAHGSPQVRSGIYETCPSLRKPTGGRPTLDRLVEMSTDGGRVARRGVRQTTDGRARVGGPDEENLRRHS